MVLGLAVHGAGRGLPPLLPSLGHSRGKEGVGKERRKTKPHAHTDANKWQLPLPRSLRNNRAQVWRELGHAHSHEPRPPYHCGAARNRPQRGNLLTPSQCSPKKWSFEAVARAEAETREDQQKGRGKEAAREPKAGEDTVPTAWPLRAAWWPRRIWDKQDCDPGPRPPPPLQACLVTTRKRARLCLHVLASREAAVADATIKGNIPIPSRRNRFPRTV